ncbi:MAG TPA: MBL fold metallo-hydrolase [Vicinamibacterales bacterium]|nr:MBL fold metallo-hydrolase [Vicinamibacterales bacterium]
MTGRAAIAWLAFCCLCAPVAGGVAARPQASGWELVVLGVAQDAGIPQLGCNQDLCRSIREGRRKPERVSSLGLVNRSLGLSYLFDATPDMVSQLATLNGGQVPAGVFLTHAHIGHYTGLMYFGRESMSAKGVPVYGTGRMTAFLKGNGPWSQLVSLSNIDLRTETPDTAVTLTGDIRVTPFAVPHRDEFTDTVGYLIERGPKRALFIPDIDQWSKWPRSIRGLVETVDLAFLDGTFASAGELPGRSIADIPHPMIPATRDLLRGTRAGVWFIHLNHTNRELGAKDVVRDGQRFSF